MGSPQADARSTLVPKHAETARAGFHDRGDDVSTGVSKARAWAATHDPRRSTPRADRRTGSRRSTSDRGASPAPSASLPTISKHSLTLFSKSFSSFPRDSASWCDRVGHDGALTLSGAPFQGTWARSVAEDASPDYNSDAEGDRFSSWLFPAGFDNDPSAGSPTETLLRLLLPLNDKVQWTSRDVAGSEPPTSPRSEHFTGTIQSACFEHSNFFKVTAPEERPGQLRPGAHRRAVGTSRPVLTDQPGSIPSRRPSRMVLNTLPRQGRGHNEARASFVSRGQNAQATSEQGLDPTLTRYSASESTIEHRCTDVVESCRSTHSDTGHD
ncbi:hypothetical protein V6N13_082722 [Hibiscus sabdariffa]